MSVAHIQVPVPVPAGATCPTRELLDLVGDKWSVLIVFLLWHRTYRFCELHRLIDGISQRMLTFTLRMLEREGLVTRTPHATVPPRVDYALTELGRTLVEPLVGLTAWANTHHDDIVAARHRHDRARGLPDGCRQGARIAI
ncbi:MAG TPA: helix-turn-helix domain-containing protein [Rugosimonospora sp.]|nr:helix-turn-helix domain-containing protein [Rugosimonospora sp.]